MVAVCSTPSARGHRAVHSDGPVGRRSRPPSHCLGSQRGRHHHRQRRLRHPGLHVDLPSIVGHDRTTSPGEHPAQVGTPLPVQRGQGRAGRVGLPQGVQGNAPRIPGGAGDISQVIAGGSTTNQAQRFAIYSKLLQRLASDVPYVPLLIEDFSVAVTDHFTYTGFNQWYPDGVWALNIERAP